MHRAETGNGAGRCAGAKSNHASMLELADRHV